MLSLRSTALRTAREKLNNSSQIFYIQRFYISRYTNVPKRPGASRQTRSPDVPMSAKKAGSRDSITAEPINSNTENNSSINESAVWATGSSRVAENPRESLERLLSNETLVVTRQIEMLNIFVGYEQNNKYAITNLDGEPLGYIVEEQGSIASVMTRQLLRTHRPFKALILDLHGSTILWLRRPFTWINSRLFVQKLNDGAESSGNSSPVIDTFAEVQQRWHLWRRRYDLFIRESPKRILSEIDQPQPEPDTDMFRQFARIDEGLWAWNFLMYDSGGKEFASVHRAFRGFGRELFTDTGQYFIKFSQSDSFTTEQSRELTAARRLSLEEKALILAMSVNIDFDYFSRHSEGAHTFLPFWWGGGGDE